MIEVGKDTLERILNRIGHQYLKGVTLSYHVELQSLANDQVKSQTIYLQSMMGLHLQVFKARDMMLSMKRRKNNTVGYMKRSNKI